MSVEVGKAASLFYCRVWQIKKRRSLYVCVCVCVCVYTHIHSRGLTRTHTILLFSHQVKSDSVTPWIAARQASQFITNSRDLPKLTSIESVMPSNHLTRCCPLLLLLSIFPNIRVFSNDSNSSFTIILINMEFIL